MLARTLMVGSRLTAGGLGRTLDSITPAAGAEVMGTGIVSIALSLDGREMLSRAMLICAAIERRMLSIRAQLCVLRDV